MRVPELSKSHHIWCENCNRNNGCKIYEERPSSCQRFKCIWYSYDLDENLRPDHCGVVFEELKGYNIYIASVNPECPEAWQEKGVMDFILQCLSKGIAIVIGTKNSSGRLRRHILVPEGKNAEDIWNDVLRFAKEQGVMRK
jgi:hypothetical protein